jgi:hypothetical protein
MMMTQPCDDVSTGTSRRQDWVTWLLLGSLVSQDIEMDTSPSHVEPQIPARATHGKGANLSARLFSILLIKLR